MQKLGIILLAMVVAVTLSGCSVPFIYKQAAPQLSEQDQAAEVVRKFVNAWLSVTYKDPQSFKAMDQYLIPEFADNLDVNAADRNKTLVEHKGYLEHGPIDVAFIKHDGNSYVFRAKTNFSVNSDTEGKNLRSSTYEDIFTVTKQPDGKLLITNTQSPSQFEKK